MWLAIWFKITAGRLPKTGRAHNPPRPIFPITPKPGLLVALCVVLAVLLLASTACQRQPPSPQVVKETVIVTRVVTRVITPALTPAPPDTLTLCFREEPTSLDPLQDTTEAGFHMRGLWGEVLLAPAPDGPWMTEVLQRVPSLENGDVQLIGAEGPDGQLRITFRFQAGWRWQDGTLLTARDVVTAWEWARNGWGAPEWQALAQDVESMRAVDDTTLEVLLRQGLMTPLFAKYLFGPYPTQWVKDHPPDTTEGPPFWPSFGPYQLERWVPGEEALWVPNPAYRRQQEGLPHLQEVRVRFLKDPEQALVALFSGSCHLLEPHLLPLSTYPLLQEAEQQRVSRTRVVLGPAWEHLDFNTWPPEGRLPFFADARARLAVLLAIDRRRLAETATYGLAPPLTSWLPEGHWAYQPLPPLDENAYSPARSKALLGEIGWRDEDGDGVLEAHGVSGTFWDGSPWEIPDNTPFAVELVTSLDDPVHAAVARFIQEALQQVGIRVDVVSLPGETLFAKNSRLRRRQFDLALFAWLPDIDVDGRYLWVGNAICRRGDGTLYAAAAGQACEADDELLYPSQIPGEDNGWEGGNIVGWANPEASLAIYQATMRLRPEDRAAYYLVHQTRFSEDLPVIPLFQRPQLWAWNFGLEGPQPGQFIPITWNIETWEWRPTGATKITSVH